MNLKKSVLSIALATTFAASAMAAPTYDKSGNSTLSVTKDIQSIIKKLDLDYSKIDDTTIKIKFMINNNDELVVLDTGDSKLDDTIKSALNYREVNSDGLKHFSVYVVPVTFDAE